jgi:rhamnopyranosyl-N-acetylglucosaminyl-diphospho-decaprenol beta-1,3/1,4-galactofuranosyltransferase
MSSRETHATAHEDRVAIVVVTYQRQELLRVLLDSFLDLTVAPWRIVIVDNENAEETSRIVERYRQHVTDGATAVPWPEGADTFCYKPQTTNTGGAGGFSAGVRTAYDLGAQWFWLMDDDVAVLPDALEKLEAWMPDHGVIQGSRLDYDGGPFYWQYRFITPLAIYNPIATSRFDQERSRPTNAVCFEGGMFSRAVVERIGFPDDRYFLYWDDCTYGYLASKVTDSVVVEDVLLRRTREVRNWEVTKVRQLGSSSDRTRYYIMRNRGYMARYLKLHGDYNPVGYALGTALSFAKEFIRLAVVDRDHLQSGTRSLFEGWSDSRALLHDPDWRPMPRPGAPSDHARARH